MKLDEIYNDKAKGNYVGVVATSGATHEALPEMVTGKFNPVGKMPITKPFQKKLLKTTGRMCCAIWKVKDMLCLSMMKGLAIENINLVNIKIIV